ncbi:hypothetical protein B0T21DRAFT_79855 [Apiosordaria backusii]|uniref:Uncharacterized protein n=1 Tax=Apiosordaria backusii TaxID=314023 RepID=A0AA40A770_9PEZI|nr:hypothetical protein B0T21DRAFT_79855 [Apiosordaria backusii]
MTQWERSVTGFAAKVFSGEEQGNSLLTDFMAEGALIAGGVPRGSATPKILRADEMKDLAKKALFTYMIPLAWEKNDDANVAILETENACGDFSNLWDLNVREVDARQVEFCFDNKQYLFLAAIGFHETCTQWGDSPFADCVDNKFSLPPNLDKLGDFDVSYRDVMEGALKTWVRNNRQNGYEFNPDNLDMADYYDPIDPARNKVVDMGLIKIPVCTLKDANYNWGGKEGNFFPC